MFDGLNEFVKNGLNSLILSDFHSHHRVDWLNFKTGAKLRLPIESPSNGMLLKFSSFYKLQFITYLFFARLNQRKCFSIWRMNVLLIIRAVFWYRHESNFSFRFSLYGKSLWILRYLRRVFFLYYWSKCRHFFHNFHETGVKRLHFRKI